MAQPIDYTGAFSRIDPMQVAQGVQAMQAQRQQAQQLQGLRALTADTDWTDPQQVAPLQRQFPGLLEEIATQQQFALGQEQLAREQRDIMDADTRRDINRTATSLLTASETNNPGVMIAAIDNHAELINATGDGITADDLKDMVVQEPGRFREFMQGVVSRTGGIPIESRKLDIEERKFSAEQANRKLELKQKGLENQVKNARDMVDLESAQQQLNQLNERRERYGSLADNVNIATDKFDSALSSATAVEQLDRSLNIAMDLNELGGNFKSVKATNILSNWFRGSTDLDEVSIADHVKAIQAGNLDIARQLAETLKPVSGEQLKLILDGLEGGDLRGTIESLRSTRINTARTVEQDRKFLSDNGAGLANSIPDVTEFRRDPFIIARERALLEPEPGGPPGGDEITPTRLAPQGALAYLRQNPQFIDQFVDYYGYRPEGY